MSTGCLVSLGISSCSNSKAMITNQQIHAFRLAPGADLKQSIINYVNEHHVEAGYLVTCAGSLTGYRIRFANRENADSGTGHFEIVSLTGTTSIYGTHLHISISDSTGKTIGGHLADGCIVYTTAEIVLGEDHTKVFKRAIDTTFGYQELKVEDR